MMNHRAAKLAQVSSVALFVATAAPAVAQAPAEGIDETDIVVTAQRVEQNLQDVPLAVTAVGGATLQRQNITDATRLEVLAPGLTIGRSGTDLRPAIRGVRTENVGANADPTIGFFIDGVYQSRPSQALAGFVDLERVEVLRGPQGTLFGRNTYGGAISLVSAKPTNTFGAGINLLYGRFNRLRADGFVNAPIAGDFAQFRIAAAYERADGFVRNTGGGRNLGEDEQYYVRPSLRLEADGAELVLRAAYWRQKGTAIGAFGYKSAGTMIDPALVSATNSGRSLGTGALLFPINTRIGDGIADVNGVDLGVPIGSPYEVAFDNTNRVDNEMIQLSADFSLDLGFGTLRSITGFTDWYSLRSSDNDFAAFPLAVDFNITDARTVSQEVQLFGNSERFDWILGGFYYSDRVYEIFFNDQNNAYPVAGSAAAAGPPFQTNPGYTLRPSGVLTGAPFALTRVDGLTPVSVNTESLAGFGQATFRFTPQFAVTGGIRYTSDRKRYSRQLLNAVNLTTANAAAAPFTQRDQRATFERATWKVGVEFKPREDSLIFAQASTGFTSGGFNGGTFVNPANGAVTPLPAFAPQTVTAYELGTKNRFADGAIQLNASIFYNDLKNLQVQSQVPFGSTVLSITGNAGAARSYGAEIEAILRPVRNFTVGINATYLNAKYNTLLLNNPFPNPAQACNAGAVGAAIPLRVGTLRCLNVGTAAAPSFLNQVDLAGARIPYSPEFTVQANVNWDIETGIGTIAPSANLLFNSGYFNTDFNTLVDRQAAFTKTDLRLTWTSLDRKFNAQVYVENLEDAAVNQRGVFGTNQSMNASYAMPRTYGIKFGARF
jgi:iron complex outermembrane recepter protein